MYLFQYDMNMDYNSKTKQVSLCSYFVCLTFTSWISTYVHLKFVHHVWVSNKYICPSNGEWWTRFDIIDIFLPMTRYLLNHLKSKKYTDYCRITYIILVIYRYKTLPHHSKFENSPKDFMQSLWENGRVLH